MRRLAFLGQGRIAARCLSVLFSPEFKDKFETRLAAGDSGVAQTCGAHGVPSLVDSAKRNEQLVLDGIRAHGVETIISVQHPWILSSEVIDAVKGQAYNLHNARLPDYRGYNSISHAILNGDVMYCTTIHWIVPQVDAGDVAYESEFPIAPDDSAYSLYHKSVEHAVKNFGLLLDALATNSQIPRRPVRPGGRFYARNEIAALKEIRSLSDFSEVDRKSRAFYFPPFEPAFFLLNGRKYFVVPKAY